jgi:hypothetical protein
MNKEWCVNSKTGEVFSYEVDGEFTDFPRGTFIAYGDYLTTGIKNKEKAIEWANEWSACNRCKAARHGKQGEKCPHCGEPLEHHEIKI